jgi:hypothetical protein
MRDGSYPSVWAKTPGGGQLHNPSIRVSADKDTNKIAKDIIRRLLPDVEALHVLVKEQIAGHELYADKKSILAHRLSAVCDNAEIRNLRAEATPTIDPFSVITHDRGDLRIGHGEISVSSDSADIKLTSLPTELALEIAGRITDAIKAYARRNAQ